MPNYLYFIKYGSRIKIGISSDVTRRLKDIGLHLETAPELLGSIKSTYPFEKHVHELLAPHRMAGEWFADCGDVRNVMGKVLAGDSLGFKSPHSKNSIQPLPEVKRTEEEWFALFNATVQILFPENAVGNLSSELGISTADVEDYLSGRVRIPKLVWVAFGGLMMKIMMEDAAEVSRQRKAAKRAA